MLLRPWKTQKFCVLKASDGGQLYYNDNQNSFRKCKSTYSYRQLYQDDAVV